MEIAPSVSNFPITDEITENFFYLLSLKIGKFSINMDFTSVSVMFEEKCIFVLNCPLSGFLSIAISMVFGINTKPSRSPTFPLVRTTTLFLVVASGSFLIRFAKRGSIVTFSVRFSTKFAAIVGRFMFCSEIQEGENHSQCPLGDMEFWLGGGVLHQMGCSLEGRCLLKDLRFNYQI